MKPWSRACQLNFVDRLLEVEAHRDLLTIQKTMFKFLKKFSVVKIFFVVANIFSMVLHNWRRSFKHHLISTTVFIYPWQWCSNVHSRICAIWRTKWMFLYYWIFSLQNTTCNISSNLILRMLIETVWIQESVTSVSLALQLKAPKHISL